MSDTEQKELNAWIAEHVMGWSKEKLGQLSCAGTFANQGGEVYIHDKGSYVRLFHPTTDPAAAMQVLERCVDVATATIRKQSDGSFCVWWTDSETMEENYIIGKTLPLAICLFAKKLFEK